MKFAKMGNNCMKKSKEADKKIVLSIFGLDDSGKTTTTKVLKGEKDLEGVVPTIGFEPQNFDFRSFNVTINDLGGGERVRDLWKHYMAESYGYIYVIDSSNSKRIEETKKEFTKFLNNPKVSGKPVLLLANKQDKNNALDESEIVQLLDIEDLVNNTQTPCRVETCAVLKAADPSLKLGFEWLIKYIETNYQELNIRIEKDFTEQKNRQNAELAEKKRKIEEKRKQERRNLPEEDDDATEYTQIRRDPFRPIGEKFKEDKKSYSSDDFKLSAYDKQSELRSSPKPRMTTIDEERNKLKNGSKFGKNKVTQHDDGSDIDLYKKNPSSWAVTQNPTMNKRSTLAN